MRCRSREGQVVNEHNHRTLQQRYRNVTDRRITPNRFDLVFFVAAVLPVLGAAVAVACWMAYRESMGREDRAVCMELMQIGALSQVIWVVVAVVSVV